MTNRIAVTGASGFLGGALARHLVASGFEVRALVRDPARFVEAGVAAVGRCDLPDVLDESMVEGADAVVHCAWATRATDVAAARVANEDGSRRVFEAARARGVRQIVFVSSIAARPDAPSQYGRSKHAVERLLDPTRDLVIRPGLVIGRGGQGLFQQLRGSMQRLRVVPVFDAGRQPLQTVHVDDVCEAVRRGLVRRLTGTLAVAEPEPIAMTAFLRLMAAQLGVRCLFVPIPFRPALAALRRAEAWGVPLPVRSENLLGLAGMRPVDVRADLARLEMTIRPAAASLAAVLGGS